MPAITSRLSSNFTSPPKVSADSTPTPHRPVVLKTAAATTTTAARALYPANDSATTAAARAREAGGGAKRHDTAAGGNSSSSYCYDDDGFPAPSLRRAMPPRARNVMTEVTGGSGSGGPATKASESAAALAKYCGEAAINTVAPTPIVAAAPGTFAGRHITPFVTLRGRSYAFMSMDNNATTTHTTSGDEEGGGTITAGGDASLPVVCDSNGPTAGQQLRRSSECATFTNSLRARLARLALSRRRLEAQCFAAAADNGNDSGDANDAVCHHESAITDEDLALAVRLPGVVWRHDPYSSTCVVSPATSPTANGSNISNNRSTIPGSDGNTAVSYLHQPSPHCVADTALTTTTTTTTTVAVSTENYAAAAAGAATGVGCHLTDNGNHHHHQQEEQEEEETQQQQQQRPKGRLSGRFVSALAREAAGYSISGSSGSLSPPLLRPPPLDPPPFPQLRYLCLPMTEQQRQQQQEEEEQPHPYASSPVCCYSGHGPVGTPFDPATATAAAAGNDANDDAAAGVDVVRGDEAEMELGLPPPWYPPPHYRDDSDYDCDCDAGAMGSDDRRRYPDSSNNYPYQQQQQKEEEDHGSLRLRPSAGPARSYLIAPAVANGSSSSLNTSTSTSTFTTAAAGTVRFAIPEPRGAQRQRQQQQQQEQEQELEADSNPHPKSVSWAAAVRAGSRGTSSTPATTATTCAAAAADRRGGERWEEEDDPTGGDGRCWSPVPVETSHYGVTGGSILSSAARDSTTTTATISSQLASYLHRPAPAPPYSSSRAAPPLFRGHHNKNGGQEDGKDGSAATAASALLCGSGDGFNALWGLSEAVYNSNLFVDVSRRRTARVRAHLDSLQRDGYGSNASYSSTNGYRRNNSNTNTSGAYHHGVEPNMKSVVKSMRFHVSEARFFYVLQHRCRRSFACAADYYAPETLVVLDGDMGVELGLITTVCTAEEFKAVCARRRARRAADEAAAAVMRGEDVPAGKIYYGRKHNRKEEEQEEVEEEVEVNGINTRSADAAAAAAAAAYDDRDMFGDLPDMSCSLDQALKACVYRMASQEEILFYYQSLPELECGTLAFLDYVREEVILHTAASSNNSKDNRSGNDRYDDDDAHGEAEEEGRRGPAHRQQRRRAPPHPTLLSYLDSFKGCGIHHMTFVACEFQADAKKLYVYHTASQPARFLGLATFLFQVFHCRIWFHNIGGQGDMCATVAARNDTE